MGQNYYGWLRLINIPNLNEQFHSETYIGLLL